MSRNFVNFSDIFFKIMMVGRKGIRVRDDAAGGCNALSVAFSLLKTHFSLESSVRKREQFRRLH
jgi:hypothetical protein